MGKEIKKTEKQMQVEGRLAQAGYQRYLYLGENVLEVAFDSHPVRRTRERMGYGFMDCGLLSENIMDCIRAIPDFMDMVLDTLEPGDKFAISRASDGLTFFGAYTYTQDEQGSGANVTDRLFINTVIERAEGRIYVDADTKLRLLICPDGNVIIDPVKMVDSDKSKKSM